MTKRNLMNLPFNLEEISKSCGFKLSDPEGKNYQKVIFHLSRYPGGLNNGEIQKRTGLSSKTISKKLKVLVDKNFITTKVLENRGVKLYILKQ